MPTHPTPVVRADRAARRDLSPPPDNDRAALSVMVRSRRTWVVTAEQVDAIRVPLVAIVGSADPNLAGVQQFTQRKPAVEMIVVEGATHAGGGGILRRPELIKNIRALLKRHATP